MTEELRSVGSSKRRWIMLASSGVALVVLAAAAIYAVDHIDSDGDGLTDWTEARGWSTALGDEYVTDPRAADTDGDGLTDLEEAGAVAGPGSTAPYVGLSDPTLADSDEDGLDDHTEVRGWASARGDHYLTAPMEPDTDRDGLADGLEAGEVVHDSDIGERVALSDPTLVDSDGDGLDDAVEADLSLNAFTPDTDGDGLDDREEIEHVGTAADAADTDGDGFDDAFEVANQETQGLDPLWPDEMVDASSYAADFARGAVLGELSPGESLSWLAGNLASGGTSLIPGIGWVVGGAADLRDALGSAIHEDWVSSTFSLVGLVPAAGDAAALPVKVTKFVVRNPQLGAGVGAIVVSLR